MKTTFLFILAAMWLVLTVSSPAQMSTFPTPPPLTPPSDDATKKSETATTDDSVAATEKKVLESAQTPTNSTPNPAVPPVTAATLTSMTALDDKAKLEAGDTISFRVIEDRDQAVSRIVTDTGEVDFPYIGRVKVDGKTCHEVAVEVKKLLEVDYYKQATVIVGLDLIIGEDKTKPKDLAWVVGEVRDVGPVELLKAQPLTVSQAIMRVGGFGEFADQRKVKLIHRGSEPSSTAPPNLSNIKDFQVVDVKSVFDGKSAPDPVLKAGDYIIVPKKFVNLYHEHDFPDLNSSADRPARNTQGDRLGSWLRRHWWIVALCIMIGLGIVDYLCLHGTPIYVSGARMMVSGRISLPQGEVYNEVLELQNFYGTQVALMKSPQTLAQAVDRVSTIHPEVPIDKDAEVDAGVELRTSIFDLKVTSTNADYAKVLLDALMDTYLASKREWKNQTTDEAVSAITEEISHLDGEIRADEQQLLDFQKTNNVVFIEEQSSSAANYLVSMNSELARLTKQHDLLSLESKDPITSGDNGATLSVTGNILDSDPSVEKAIPGSGVGESRDIVTAEKDRIEKLKILRDQYGIYLKDAHPKMKDLADAIAKEEKFLALLKTRSKTDQDARREDLELQIKNLQAQIAVWNDKSLELSQRLGTFQDLKSKITREQTLYNQTASSIQNVDLNKSLDQEDVVILEAASPATPVVHNYLLRLLYGVGGGLVAGFVLVFIVIRLDNKINSPLDLEENIDFPLVGEIPLTRLDPKSKRVPLLAEDDQRHEFLEHHRDIRSSLLFSRTDAARPRSVMITSAAPGEGKSTLAANLASTFAFSGFRVLLIDADLRKGIQHTIFGKGVDTGLSNYLLGEIPWREVVQSTQLPNLDILARGKVPMRAGDLLLSGYADLLIQESMAEYDIVFWDTAPLYAAHDAANLCSKVDGILFLARVRHSSVSLVRSALEDLFQKNAKIFGVVLNAVKPGQHGYHHKYRYREYGAVTAEV